MGLASDLRVLYHMAFTPVRGGNHGDRLEAFYREQRGAYDDFRKRLLHGRKELMRRLDVPDGATLLDMGGGTGNNVEYLGDRVTKFKSIRVVDLCPSLLQVAAERVQQRRWTNVGTILADVTTYQPNDAPVDAVTFSYSLTMIPNWFQAIDQAYQLLKPRGVIGVVDFYVSRKWPAPGLKQHRWWQRAFWPTWFASDNVFLSSEHIPYLQGRFQTVLLEERLGKVPYLLGLKAPYYLFLGRRV
jgi:S-adenosylmethionine-diacylgycerolhomoserine-N-methlytransferase